MSQQPESGGVPQPNHDNVPSGDSEERLNWSEARLASDESWRGVHHNQYRSLYHAAQRGDWKSAERIIENDRNALTVRISVHSRTVLQIAAISRQWGFVLKLLERVSTESTELYDYLGDTVLHHVAKGGSLNTAKALIEKNPNLPHRVNEITGWLPLRYSFRSECNEMVWYLTLKTRVESSPLLFTLLEGFLASGYLDVALYFVQQHPQLVLAKGEGEHDKYLLFHLAMNPSYFLSGSNLGFLERLIYKFVHVEWHPKLLTSTQPENYAIQVFQRFKRLFWKGIARLVPSIKVIQDAKLKHESAVKLVNYVCKQLSTRTFEQIFQYLRSQSILLVATEHGTEEIIKSLLQHFPDLIYCDIRTVSRSNILEVAIKYRQEKIVNILKDISLTITKNLCTECSKFDETNLHLAGKLAHHDKLYSVSGATFQMQRELQWFKEVEKLTFAPSRKWKNNKYETAEEVFRREHKQLAEQGEKWMKDTANSCMLVSTLIATVLFTAAFTVPGGNVNDKGIPIFLRTKAFTVFAVSNAFGLFSSLTSLLMFLAILTARYAIDDFLESLPKKLIIGLGSLFLAIVSMIVAFGATLTIVLGEKWNWISMPIALVASIPVAIFVMLQLPLFFQMVRSTYGPSMFRP